MQKNFFIMIMILLGFLNCAKTEYYMKNVNHKVRLTSFSEEEGYKLKRRFDLSHTRVNIFWGIVRVYNKDLDKILKEEFKNPEKEAIGNLTLVESYDFLDSCLDLLSLGIIRLYSLKVNGDIYEMVAEPTKIKVEIPEQQLELEKKTGIEEQPKENQDILSNEKQKEDTQIKPQEKIKETKNTKENKGAKNVKKK